MESSGAPGLGDERVEDNSCPAAHVKEETAAGEQEIFLTAHTWTVLY